MIRRAGAAIAAAGLLAACAGTADQPPWPGRMGRFLGLVANCGCSDITPARMIADYAKAAGSGYSAADLAGMRGYVMLAATEMADNRIEICGETCAQRCMVATVVAPLGGRDGGAAPCPVTERDLHLTEPRQIDKTGP